MPQRPLSVLQARHARQRGSTLAYALVLVMAIAATIGVMLLLQNIAARKSEGRQVVFRVVDIDESTDDPAFWGKNFPRQYDGYIRTADNERTRYGGSEALPLGDRAPGDGVASPDKPASKLEADPRLVTIFSGYAFALDYRERRGHAFMLHDQRQTDRVRLKPQPGACLNCHASTVNAFRQAGLKAGAPGDLKAPLLSDEGQAQLYKGFHEINKMPYIDATSLVEHPVACVDCHDPQTMALRITRPAFVEGIRVLAQSAEPTPHLPSIEKWRKSDRSRPYDPNADASRQEMRSMACAQCHVEYYFKGDDKTLTYPWHNGLKIEQIEKYYNDLNYKDFTHAISGAPALKAQHPEFETWSQGIHARSGVSCADCHMPYKREGAIKVSDHQVRSPMLNIARSCQTCHHYSDEEIRQRVANIQDRTFALMGRAEDATVALINALAAAKTAGATDAQLAPARALQRKAQFRTDYVNAENSMGFHAPQETARILGEAIDYARQGELVVKSLTIATGPRATAPSPITPRQEAQTNAAAP